MKHIWIDYQFPSFSVSEQQSLDCQVIHYHCLNSISILLVKFIYLFDSSVAKMKLKRKRAYKWRSQSSEMAQIKLAKQVNERPTSVSELNAITKSRIKWNKRNVADRIPMANIKHILNSLIYRMQTEWVKYILFSVNKFG